MKSILFIFSSICCFHISQGQQFTVSADKMNELYIGVDNPISVTIENLPTQSIILKTNNGKITGSNGHYIYSGGTVGPANIVVYKKVNGNIKLLGLWPFRVKHLPLPVFKIGSGKNKMPATEIASQEYVRAALENIDIDMRYTIDSFTVCIISSDTCKFTVKKNYGNKISAEIKNEFLLLHQNDIVVFKDIFIKQPDGTEDAIAPVMITVLAGTANGQ